MLYSTIDTMQRDFNGKVQRSEKKVKNKIKNKKNKSCDFR